MTADKKIVILNRRVAKLMEETYEKVGTVKRYLDSLIDSGAHDNLRGYRIVGEVTADLDFDFETCNYYDGELRDYVVSEWNVTAEYGQELLGKEHFFHADKNFNKGVFAHFDEKICEATYDFVYSKKERRSPSTVYKISVEELAALGVSVLHSSVYVIWGELIYVNYSVEERDKNSYKRRRKKRVPLRYRRHAEERIVALQKLFIEMEYGYDEVKNEIANVFLDLNERQKKLFGTVEMSNGFLYHKRRPFGIKTKNDRMLEFSIASQMTNVSPCSGFSFRELRRDAENKKMKLPVRITVDVTDSDIANWCEPFYLMDPPFNKYRCTYMFHCFMDHSGISYAEVVSIDAKDIQPYWIVRL